MNDIYNTRTNKQQISTIQTLNMSAHTMHKISNKTLTWMVLWATYLCLLFWKLTSTRSQDTCVRPLIITSGFSRRGKKRQFVKPANRAQEKQYWWSHSQLWFDTTFLKCLSSLEKISQGKRYAVAIMQFQSHIGG